jgi:hypothetical protein
LQAEEEALGHSEIAAKPQIDFGTNRRFAVEKSAKLADRDARALAHLFERYARADQEILAQIVNLNFRIDEVAVPTRYFAQASSASFFASTRYGLSILWLLLRYRLHRSGILRARQFDSLERRYRSDASIKPAGH